MPAWWTPCSIARSTSTTSASTPSPTSATACCQGDLGDTPFNITTPRYDEYHRDQLGFPQIIFTGDIKRLPERARVKRGGDPADYMAWVGGIAVVNQQRAQAKTTDDYMSRVPYRSISR